PRRRFLAGDLVGDRGDGVSVPHDGGLRARLPGPPCAADVRGLRGPGRRDDRLLEQRALEHGEPVLLGEGAGAAPALPHHAGLADEHPVRHGARRNGDDHIARDRDPRRGEPPVPRADSARPRAPRVRPLPSDARRRLRARYDPEQPLPPLGAGSVAHGHPLPGADLPGLGLLLSRARAGALGGVAGRAPSDHARTRRHPPDPLRQGGARLRAARVDSADPGRAPRPLPLPRASRARDDGAPGEAGRPAHAPRRMKRTFEVIRAASWLGWQVEANWADPFLFVVYSIAKPLSTTLILFFMVRVVAQGHATAESFLFLFVGNTFFLYVTEVLIGISWAVFRDREDFETLKYIYTAPIRLLPYLLGRAVTKVVTASIGVAVALLFGRFVLGLEIGGDAASWARLAGAVALGLVSVAWLGIALAGASLVV